MSYRIIDTIAFLVLKARNLIGWFDIDEVYRFSHRVMQQAWDRGREDCTEVCLSLNGEWWTIYLYYSFMGYNSKSQSLKYIVDINQLNRNAAHSPTWYS